MPGVFAAGDVRHGSIKRVASAVGEGAMAIAFVHRYLAPELVPRFAQVAREERRCSGRKDFGARRAEWMLLTFYEKFEQIVILILTGLIAIVIVFAVWNLALKIFHGVIAPQTFDPTEYSVFQAVFGTIFTVIIALEFKRSLLVVAQRQESVVQVRTVILIALLAIVRKVLILDLASTEALQLSRWRRQSSRLVPSIGSFATKIAASSAISHRKTVSRGDNRRLARLRGRTTAGNPMATRRICRFSSLRPHRGGTSTIRNSGCWTRGQLCACRRCCCSELHRAAVSDRANMARPLADNDGRKT